MSDPQYFNCAECTKFTVAAAKRRRYCEVPIPEALRGQDVPLLGVDQDKLLRRAMRVSGDHKVRLKWLHAINHLRVTSKTGWIMDGGAAKFGHGITTKSHELNSLTLSP